MKQIALTGLMAAALAGGIYGCDGGEDSTSDGGDGAAGDGGAKTAELQAQLEANKEKWSASGIKGYTYQVSVACYCPDFWDNNPVLVTVENGTAASVVSEKTGEDASKYYAGYDTVDALFATISHELAYADETMSHTGPASSGDILDLDFDPTYGFPTSYQFDLAQVADESIQITVSEFKLVSPTVN